MEEDKSLNRTVAEKLFGATVRTAIIAGAAILATKTHLSSDQVSVLKEPIDVFASSTSELVVSIGTILLAYGWSIWEKVTTIQKVEKLKDQVIDAKIETEQLRQSR